MQIIDNPNKSEWDEILERPTQSVQDIELTVNEIFSEIRQKGDIAVSKYTELFDGVVLKDIKVGEDEIQDAVQEISTELKAAINTAKENIEKFHKAQKSDRIEVETTPGVQCWMEKRPIEKVGLYIPGGSAPLFSTILMLAIPATLAGCKEIVLCTPPNKEGKVAPAILYAASLCGVTQVFKVGGIQAIGAMTFGTATIPKVFKIFGPGNQFVTVAKQLATKFQVAIDMPAGPSELMIFADETAVPSFLASDLLSQAEHGADSQVMLVCTSKKIAEETQKEIKVQVEVLNRKYIVNQSIENSKIILMDKNEDALSLINAYGPEHLIIVSENEEFFVNGLSNAGSVFLGNFTPESAGDYASGTNHTLPTNGYAKQYSGVNLESFMKSMTFQKISEDGIKNIGSAIECMAEAEGLQAHKNAVTLRLNYLNA
ncbi:histidinol dehydrogenase [Aureisphaera galaxeae]|uniref:histidinol dehydrogenase n=1 Tax=Aureisphaera galaxeae TaxID=1538023 RepID=UPI00235043BC|nr:histidinol dehydrogenase [Aureisphaera galaxeae]MDC8004382.1 histidinol dehydrogenase [Aureisphaera galaxeae]